MNTMQRIIKRLMDSVVSAVALVCLSPLLFLIAVAVRVTSPGSVIFRQQRLGKHGAHFSLYKFRTMYHGSPQAKASDGSNLVVKDDPRITPVGRFLRPFSLDELPQLVNVLLGDMSLVGPRPDQVEHLALYAENDKRKLATKPGLTGLAMVRGRNCLPWRERVRLDIWYVEHYSLLLDLQILMQTVPVVLFRRGTFVEPKAANAEDKGHA